jgi:hypothetical protein
VRIVDSTFEVYTYGVWLQGSAKELITRIRLCYFAGNHFISGGPSQRGKVSANYMLNCADHNTIIADDFGPPNLPVVVLSANTS